MLEPAHILSDPCRMKIDGIALTITYYIYMHPEVKKIPRVQKAAGMLFPMRFG